MSLLLLAILAGLLSGGLRAWYRKRSLRIPDLNLIWLVIVAFLLQILAFQFRPTQKIIPDSLAAAALISSLLFLLAFAWFNQKQPGFWLLGLGLVLNLAVISLNGGLMPISPETVTQIAPHAPADAWQVGKRLGAGKDIVLPAAETRLWWLSDRFLAPGWFPYRIAFSMGDIFIAAGAFWLPWSLGSQVE